MEIHGLKTGERQLWSACVSCWWSAAQKRVEESRLFHGHDQEQQKRTWLLLAEWWMWRWQSWLREGQPQLWGSLLTAQWTVTFATSPWNTWADSRGRWDKMDGMGGLIGFLHLQEQSQSILVPDLFVWHHSGCFIGKLWFWARRGLICLMDRDQVMSW